MAYIPTVNNLWTPTLTGGTSAGTTTYTVQTANYSKNGRLVEANALITITGATGTGDAIIGGFPFNFANESFGVIDINASGWTWPTSTTQLTVEGISGTKTAKITASGSTVAASALQMTNAACSVNISINYLTND